MTQSSLIQADYDGYSSSVAGLQRRFSEFPRSVSIETQVRCNAKCGFCPYPGSPRQGQELPEEIVHKLIDELAEMPPTHRFSMTLHRLNEPLLDRRLKAFSERVAQRLPGATQHFVSNGSMLREANVEWMAQFAGAALTVSLNSVDEAEHTRIMGFGLEGVHRGLDYVHALKAAGRFDLPVRLAAQYQGEAHAVAYEAACRARWPLFTPGVRPYFEWMGGSGAGKEQRVHFGLPSPAAALVSGFPCGQWFDLHVLASGFATRCCIDETGFDSDDFDVRRHHVLEVYGRTQALRTTLPARRDVAGCKGCMHLG